MITSLPPRPERPPKVVVIGDLILDRYTWGNVSRISPEAPIPILQADEEEVRLGGAASVASLLAGLNASVSLNGIAGNDPERQILAALVRELQIDTSAILSVDDRPTTCKHRFIGRACGRHAHQILRVDNESTVPISSGTEAALLREFRNAANDADAVLVSDYGKGVWTGTLLHSVIEECRLAGIPVLVDPARDRDFSIYNGATLLKPNRHEASAFLKSLDDEPFKVEELAERLFKHQFADQVVVTLDRDGLAYSDGSETCHLPCEQRDVYDITGAGDTVLAMLGYAAAANWPLRQAATLANVAAGLQVQRLGITQVSWEEIEDRCHPVKSHITTSKVCTLDEAVAFVNRCRHEGKSIVFTNGCFDLFHVGHLHTLQGAASLGDILIVGVNSDDSVSRLKGPTRPIIPADQRAEILASIEGVDRVVIFDEDTPHRALNALRPDILVKGGSTQEIVGMEVVQAYGGIVRSCDLLESISTTNILDSTRNHQDRGEQWQPENTG
ncbi:MAG: bifunctional heptose 7-phosphate kinase/heptose 1-phosphate adenyltransferase [Planctomycetaceae bacterium]|nr:bifunctional heptose 7-phosphate kinase/heptose 1-phosphate adenyltransferase [Planctomycetaceae bacterium]